MVILQSLQLSMNACACVKLIGVCLMVTCYELNLNNTD